MTTTYTTIGADQLLRWSLKGICNDTDEEFVDRIDDAVNNIATRTGCVPNTPGYEPWLNVFGYGRIREALTHPDPNSGHGYFWAHEAGELLGWESGKARRVVRHAVEVRRHPAARGR